MRVMIEVIFSVFQELPHLKMDHAIPRSEISEKVKLRKSADIFVSSHDFESEILTNKWIFSQLFRWQQISWTGCEALYSKVGNGAKHSTPASEVLEKVAFRKLADIAQVDVILSYAYCRMNK